MKRYTNRTTSSDWSPFESLANLTDELGRIFDASTRGMSEEISGLWRPAVDIVQAPDHVRVMMEVPGFKREEVRVNCEKGQLTITGTRTKAVVAEDEEYLRSERRYGTFRRELPLSTEVDVEGITAKLREGVLTVTLPRSAKSRGVDIEVEEA